MAHVPKLSATLSLGGEWWGEQRNSEIQKQYLPKRCYCLLLERCCWVRQLQLNSLLIARNSAQGQPQSPTRRAASEPAQWKQLEQGHQGEQGEEGQKGEHGHQWEQGEEGQKGEQGHRGRPPLGIPARSQRNKSIARLGRSQRNEFLSVLRSTRRFENHTICYPRRAPAPGPSLKSVSMQPRTVHKISVP